MAERIATQVLPSAEHWQRPSIKTFSELASDVHRIANAFTTLGISRHDAVELMSPNCDELSATLLAAEASGIASPLNPALGEAPAQRLLVLPGARILAVAGPELDSALWQRGRQLALSVGASALFALRPTGAADIDPALEPMTGVQVAYLAEAAAGQPADRLIATPPSADDIATCFTPEARRAIRNLLRIPTPTKSSTRGCSRRPAMSPMTRLSSQPCRFACECPYPHAASPLLRGQQVVWAGPLGYRDPALYQVFWQLVENYGVHVMSGVPTVYAMLANVPVDAKIDTSQVAAVGASPLPAAVRRAFESHTGVVLTEGYGLTEGTCASARSRPGHAREGAVGQRLPYVQMKAVRIENGAWRDVAPDTPGVIVVKGPTVFPGYLLERTPDGPQLDGLGKIVDGWLDTGDLGRVDREGYLWLTGRAKDLIIRGGHNIDPQMIEDVLLTHLDVTEAAAVGRPDAHSGEVPVAYVAVRAGATIDADELRRYAADNVPETAAAPKDVVIVDAIPTTEVGKPYKPELRRDAVDRVVRGALIDTSATITTTLVDGVPTVTITGVTHDQACAALDAYTLSWRLI